MAHVQELDEHDPDMMGGIHEDETNVDEPHFMYNKNVRQSPNNKKAGMHNNAVSGGGRAHPMNQT